MTGTLFASSGPFYMKASGSPSLNFRRCCERKGRKKGIQRTVPLNEDPTFTVDKNQETGEMLILRREMHLEIISNGCKINLA